MFPAVPGRTAPVIHLADGNSADSVDCVSEAEIIDSLNNGIIIDEVSGNAANGAWIYVRGADFGYGASAFTAEP